MTMLDANVLLYAYHRRGAPQQRSRAGAAGGLVRSPSGSTRVTLGRFGLASPWTMSPSSSTWWKAPSLDDDARRQRAPVCLPSAGGATRTLPRVGRGRVLQRHRGTNPLGDRRRLS